MYVQLEGPEGGTGALWSDTTTSDGGTLLRNLAMTKEFEHKINKIMSIMWTILPRPFLEYITARERSL